MPFKSQAQRAFLYSQHPEIAKRWEKHTPEGKLPERVGKMEGQGLAGPTSSGALTGYSKRTTPKELKAKAARLQYATPAGPVTAPSMGLKGKMCCLKCAKKKKKRALFGKFSPTMARQEGWGAQGSQRTPVIPDYAQIYYAPEDPEKRKQEAEASLNRRRSLGDGTQKFGFHGLSVPQDEPILRYVVQKDNVHDSKKIGQRGPVVRAPKLVSSKAVLRGKLAARR